MGMDYIGYRPKNDRGKHLHLNWSGHSWLHSLLNQLDCDLDTFSGSNDGLRIPAKTCRQWSKAMYQALQAGWLMINVYADSHYMGNERTVPTVCKTDTPPPHTTKDFKELRPLAQNEVTFLEEIMNFFDSCGGCRQC